MNTLFTPSMIRHVFVAVISGVILAAIGFKSDSVHLPFFINLLFSIGLGWLQPQKGWVLAVAQVAALLSANLLITDRQLMIAEKPDIAYFTATLGFLPTLAGAFMGAFFKRALKTDE